LAKLFSLPLIALFKASHLRKWSLVRPGMGYIKFSMQISAWIEQQKAYKGWKMITKLPNIATFPDTATFVLLEQTNGIID